MMINDILEDIKGLMSEFRYKHVIKVANLAEYLAHIYNLDEDKLFLTGLLHDVAKDFTDEQVKFYIDKYNLDKKLLDKDMEYLVHSYIGAQFIKEKYGIVDKDIIEAITYHTIGNKRMNNYAKVIYIADKLARDNLSDELLEIKELSFRNLDEALVRLLKYSERKLNEKGKDLHPDSKELLQLLNQDKFDKKEEEL